MTKEPHGVDDGWWEGELDGKFGNFPSLVVEECDENGEPLTEPDDDDISDSCPPVHSPPTIPPDLIPPEGIIISEPDFSPSEKSPPAVELTKQQIAKENFEIDLSRGGQQKPAFQAPSGKI